MNTSLRSVTVLLAVCALAGTAFAQEARTSKNTPQLEQWRNQFPDADADKDGVLTEAEARDYREKLRPSGNRNPDSAKRPQPTHANVSYGPHERNVLDVYLAKSDSPTPVVIYIHGGGFVAGSKDGVSPRVIQLCHNAGVSVAAINYRFVSTDPFPAPQQDAARAVQFLRSKAKEWNLDPERFAAYGGSAGAGLSMWLGFHDDGADPNSTDPVAKQSTRLKGIGSMGGQTTYDPNVIKAWVGGRAHEHPSVFLCYSLQSIEDMTKPELQPVYDEVSAIKHLTTDDPPIFMIYSEPNAPLPPDARPGQGIHHPVFGHKLKAEMDKLGIECIYRHASQGGGGDAEMVNFLLMCLDVKAPAA